MSQNNTNKKTVTFNLHLFVSLVLLYGVMNIKDSNAMALFAKQTAVVKFPEFM